jgi:hypothetical protein
MEITLQQTHKSVSLDLDHSHKPHLLFQGKKDQILDLHFDKPAAIHLLIKRQMFITPQGEKIFSIQMYFV